MFNAIRLFGGFLVRNYATIASGYVIGDIFGDLFDNKSADKDDGGDTKPKPRPTGLEGYYYDFKKWVGSFGLGKWATGLMILTALYFLAQIFSKRKK